MRFSCWLRRAPRRLVVRFGRRLAKSAPLLAAAVVLGFAPAARADAPPAKAKPARTPQIPLDPQKLLAERGIWPYDVAVVSRRNHLVSVTPSFRLGRLGPPLAGADLFAYLGREDYAERYRLVQGTKATLMVSGAVALAIGTGLAAAGVVGSIQASQRGPVSNLPAGACAVADAATGNCMQAAPAPLLMGGVATAVAGLAAIIVGAAVDPSPISDAEVWQLVTEFNAKLQSGTPAQPEAAPPSGAASTPGLGVSGAPGRAVPSWRVTGFDIPGGGGVALALRF